MPGPPTGPSLRMTRTSPAAYSRLRTASTHSSSSSNTRAVPSNTRFFRPATLMTAPSGQRLPLRTATPPSGAGGLRALGIDAGDHRHVGHRQSHRLGNHCHGVGGELSGAGANRRQARTLDAGQRRLIDFAGHEAADGLVGIQYGEGFSFEPAG